MLAEGAPEGRASAAQGLAGACNQLVAAGRSNLGNMGLRTHQPNVVVQPCWSECLGLGICGATSCTQHVSFS